MFSHVKWWDKIIQEFPVGSSVLIGLLGFCVGGVGVVGRIPPFSFLCRGLWNEVHGGKNRCVRTSPLVPIDFNWLVPDTTRACDDRFNFIGKSFDPFKEMSGASLPSNSVEIRYWKVLRLF